MSDEMVLLLFDHLHPCWNEESVFLAGEDPESLGRLHVEGLLDKNNDRYFLSAKGIDVFKTLSSQWFCETVPVEESLDEAAQKYFLWRTTFQSLLDRSFVARWGAKDYHLGLHLEYSPALSGKDFFVNESSHIVWTYDSHPLVKKMKEDFSLSGVKAREKTPRTLEEIKEWHKLNNVPSSFFYVDLLLLGRYDFAYYMHYPKHPNDVLGLVNADKFFCFQAPKPFEHVDSYIETIGKVHLFLLNQRRMYIPGYVDLDSADQDSLNWIIWIVDTEEEALSLHKILDPMGESLIGPARPLDVWILSLEALRNVHEKYEMVYDLFPHVAHSVIRSI